MRAVVAYPSAMLAPTEAAQAFLEAGFLARYETTLAYCPGALPDRALHAASRLLLRGRAERALERRSLGAIPHRLVERRLGWDVLRMLAGRAGAGPIVGDWLWERAMLDFDRAVARRLSRSDGLVYGCEHACEFTFERAAELGIRRVYDMAAPHFTFSQALQAEQAQLHPEVVTAYWHATHAKAAPRNARKQREFDLADLVIANSAFTARTLTQTGYPERAVRVVPLGAPPVDGRWRETAYDGVLRFVFAGSISVHKGAHHLLAAWRAIGARAGAELILAGDWALPARFAERLPASVKQVGRLPQSELFALFRRSSALVLPSLGDGFGMVVSEALAHGLPVIATHNVGASDLLNEGVNGWIVPPGDADRLAECLAWCLDHAAEVHGMRLAAEQTAAAHPWSEYRRRLVWTIQSYFGTNEQS